MLSPVPRSLLWSVWANPTPAARYSQPGRRAGRISKDEGKRSRIRRAFDSPEGVLELKALCSAMWRIMGTVSAYLVSDIRPHQHGHTGMLTQRPSVADCRNRPFHHLLITEKNKKHYSDEARDDDGHKITLSKSFTSFTFPKSAYILLNAGDGGHFPEIIFLVKSGSSHNLVLLLQWDEVLYDQMSGGYNTNVNKSMA